MSLILNIETATTSCSVCLAEGENILALREENNGYTHAEHITVFIEDVFQTSGRKLSELDAIAVSSGPGSYTGLRIGASTAKGLCYALNKPLISVSTLKALAYKLIHIEEMPGWHTQVSDEKNKEWQQQNLFCPMIDARRMEVYCAVYDSSLNEIHPVTAKVIDENSFAEILEKQKVIFFGDGAAKCKSVLSHKKNAFFIDGLFPSAYSMRKLSHTKFYTKQFEDTSLYEPLYLKEVFARKAF